MRWRGCRTSRSLGTGPLNSLPRKRGTACIGCRCWSRTCVPRPSATRCGQVKSGLVCAMGWNSTSRCHAWPRCLCHPVSSPISVTGEMSRRGSPVVCLTAGLATAVASVCSLARILAVLGPRNLPAVLGVLSGRGCCSPRLLWQPGSGHRLASPAALRRAAARTPRQLDRRRLYRNETLGRLFRGEELDDEGKDRLAPISPQMLMNQQQNEVPERAAAGSWGGRLKVAALQHLDKPAAKSLGACSRAVCGAELLGAATSLRPSPSRNSPALCPGRHGLPVAGGDAHFFPQDSRALPNALSSELCSPSPLKILQCNTLTVAVARLPEDGHGVLQGADRFLRSAPIPRWRAPEVAQRHTLAVAVAGLPEGGHGVPVTW